MFLLEQRQRAASASSELNVGPGRLFPNPSCVNEPGKPKVRRKL
jgi:hypothetical protein